MASILELNYNQMEETGFSLTPEVLSWLQREDAALTRSLVESCGLKLRGPGHPVTRDPEVVPQLSALYASLAGLQLLAEPGLGRVHHLALKVRATRALQDQGGGQRPRPLPDAEGQLLAQGKWGSGGCL